MKEAELERVHLFSKYALSGVLEAHRMKVGERVQAIPADRLESADIDTLTETLYDEVKVRPIVLREDEITVQTSEVQIEATHVLNVDPYVTPYVLGIRVSYHVPFDGDQSLLQYRPNRHGPRAPRAAIIGHELVFFYDRADKNITETRADFEKDLNNLKTPVGWQTAQIDEFNHVLRGELRRGLIERRATLEQTRRQVDSLGYKVRPKREPTPPARPPAPVAKKAGRETKRRAEPEPKYEYDVALSFAGEERDYVGQVASLLKEAGVRVFYDEFEEVDLWGKNLVDHLAEVYGKASRFVVMFASKNYAAKAWPNHERQHALAHALKEERVVVLPARFDDTAIPGLPDTVKYIDLRKTPPERLAELILEKIRREQ